MTGSIRRAFRASAIVVLSMLSGNPSLAAAPAAPIAAPAPSAPFVAEVARLAAKTDGTVGVAVKLVGSNSPTLAFNGGAPFPMASTFKIAVAGTILSRIDRGELKLDTMVPVEPADIIKSDGIADMLLHPGVSLSVYNLMELMLTHSDNTATDLLVRQAGGPAAVNAWLARLGVVGQRVDSDVAHVLYRSLGIENPGSGSFTENVEAAVKAHPELLQAYEKQRPNPAFITDPRDTTTPEAMVDLLTKIETGKALSPANTRVLLDIMGRCKTGDQRLKGMLPAGTAVAHKTGSLVGVANDVGFITLPDGRKLAIAVFVKGDTKGTMVQDRVIAEIARTAFDYYLVGGAQ